MKKITLIIIFFSFFWGNNVKASASTLYFNGTVDSNWETLGNWCTDQLDPCTTSESLPIAEDNVVIIGIIAPDVDLDTWTQPANIDANTTGINFTSAISNTININITGNPTFNNSSSNGGSIIGDPIFNDNNSSNNGIIIGNPTFNNSSSNGNLINGNATFNDSSSNTGLINGNHIFNDSSSNGGTITGNPIFNGSDSNNTYNGIIIGNPTFNNSSVNNGTITGNPTFNNSSVNNGGTITGNPIFNDSSGKNGGTIIGNLIFNGDLSEDNGGEQISGTKTRKYTSNISTSRDFTRTGPWTVITNGAMVDLTTATYDVDVESPTYTTFKTQNNGIFLPNSIISSPLLNSVTSIATSITTSGVTLNGSIVSIGSENATTRGFNYGLDTSYGTNTTESGSFGTGEFSKNISNLACETTYHYRSYFVAGPDATYGEDQTFTTSICPIVSSGGHSSGGSSYIKPVIVQPQLPIIPINLNLGCLSGYLFNIQTGKPCPKNIIIENTTNNNQGLNISSRNRILKLILSRMRGDDIKTLQIYLTNFKYDCGVIDGVFGKKTQVAVMAFQRSKGLIPDGIVGPKTKELMK